jgi:hypothetical protein
MEITWNKNSLRGTKDPITWIRCFELNIEITWNKNSYCMEEDRIDPWKKYSAMVEQML